LSSGLNFTLASLSIKLGAAGIQLGLWALLAVKKKTGTITQTHVPMQQHFSISIYPNIIKRNIPNFKEASPSKHVLSDL
jgi:hypothetical protein